MVCHFVVFTLQDKMLAARFFFFNFIIIKNVQNSYVYVIQLFLSPANDTPASSFLLTAVQQDDAKLCCDVMWLMHLLVHIYL